MVRPMGPSTAKIPETTEEWGELVCMLEAVEKRVEDWYFSAMEDGDLKQGRMFRQIADDACNLMLSLIVGLNLDGLNDD